VTQVKAGSRPVRVLHLRDSPWVDGPGRTIIESAVHFDPDRINYHIGVLIPSGNARHPMIDVAVQRKLSALAFVDRGGLDFNVVKSILSAVDELQITVLHTSDLRTRLFSLFVRIARPHLISVTTAHGWIANTARRRVLRLVDKALLRCSDMVILVSQAMRALVPRWWLPEDRVTVLHNALVLEKYGHAVSGRERRPPDTSKQVELLNVGRLSPEKGQDLLLRAVARLVPQFPNVRLYFAGTGPMERTLRALTAELGLDSRVEFLGFVEDMPALYSRADLVVQSSLTEGLPNVILEAAYLGVPILATDVGGTREVVEQGRHALLVPSGSVDALAGGLRQYLSNPIESLLMAKEASRRISARFSFVARTDHMTTIYERLTQSQQARDSA
jgi:glycosyltransferase involved in cell wall biosynthesis